MSRHDRGSYVASRLAFDAPAAVTRLAVLDSVPIAEALDRADARFAAAWWHWFFFAQPDKPERAILADPDPDAWYGGDPEHMGAENHADYQVRSTTPPPCGRCAMTTAPGSVSTVTQTGRTVPPAAAPPPAPRWCCGQPRRPGRPPQRRPRHLEALDHRVERRPHRQRPPQRRGRTRGAGGTTQPLPRPRHHLSFDCPAQPAGIPQEERSTDTC